MDEGVPRPETREGRRRPAHTPRTHHRHRQRELALPPRPRTPRTQTSMTPRPQAAPAAIAAQALAPRARPSRRHPRRAIQPGNQATSTPTTTDARWGHFKPSRRGQCKPSFSPEASIKTYLYDPTGDKARAVKARYRGVCRGCGAPTAPRNGKGDAYAYCKRCHPGAIAPEWTRERVREAMSAWRARYGAAPSSYDWSRTHARRRGGEALKRLQAGEWPAPSTVIDLYGSWAAAVADAFGGA